MSRYSGQPARPRAGGRRALSTGLCIFLLAAGAIFRFAVPAGSHVGVNLHVVGVIVFCAGLLGLILPRLPGTPVSPDRLRRWVIPSGARGPAADPGGDDLGGDSDGQPMVGNHSAEPGRPTLADDLVNSEKDPPL